jgi:hypothetical protein
MRCLVGNSHKLVLPYGTCHHQLTPSANFVHLVDNVVVLDSEGALTYCGPPKGWMSQDEEVAKGQDEELPEVEEAPNPEIFEGDADHQDLKPRAEDDPETIKRQKGDMGVWIYYGKSIGGWPIIVLFICIAVNVFGNNFQSKLKDLLTCS